MTPGGEIGHEDSFFALGGNSLSAARLMFRIREEFDVELRIAAFYEAATLAACAAAIDEARARQRQPRPRPQGPQRLPVGAAGTGGTGSTASIGRRDRSAYRVAVPGPRGPRGFASHLISLTGEWALWRTTCLRAAGFGVQLLEALGDR